MTAVDETPAEVEPEPVDLVEREPGELSIAYVGLDEIAVADINPRQHDLPSLISAIKRFGFMEPVTLDERTGKLVGGHGRLKALQRMRDRGDPRPPGVLPGSDGRWEIAVVEGWESRNDDHAIAALASLNRQSEKAAWEPIAYAEMLQGLDERAPYLLESAGYVPQDLSDLLAQVGDLPDYTKPTVPERDWDDRDRVDRDTAPWDRDPLPPPRADPEPTPEPREQGEPAPITPTSKPGDVWLLGEHQLVCGETDLAYADIICMRWQEHSSEPATDLDGEPFPSLLGASTDEDDDQAEA